MYKILIVDDDPIMAKVLVSMFRSEKYEVTSCHTGGEGMQAAQKELPDLVLMDINLPDGNGLDFCKQLKTNPRLKHIPVILITGDATSVENKVAGMENGADDYVLKPFIADELMARAAGIIKRSMKFGSH
jgi:DNA-binding response OmpR family regulator